MYPKGALCEEGFLSQNKVVEKNSCFFKEFIYNFVFHEKRVKSFLLFFVVKFNYRK